MAFHVPNCSMEMEKKLMQSQLSNCNTDAKGIVLNKYGSFEALKTQAKKPGNWEAKSDLSTAYQYGIPELNVEIDSDKAIGWQESSIDDGNPHSRSFLNLATMYDSKGTVPSRRKAHELYQKAAEYGEVAAELNLAESYRCGISNVIEKDIEEAFKWYKRAAGEDQSINTDNDISIQAQLTRGTLRKLGVDFKIEALSRLHKYYMEGDCPEGKPQPLKAVYYLKKAAEKGHSESQLELGRTYLFGNPQGVQKDLNKAKRWLGKAAQNGSVEAKEVLEKFDQQGVIEATTSDTEQDNMLKCNQLFDIFKEFEKDENDHPFLIKESLIFTEPMFSQFPDSPTAQRYLKSFKLAQEGLDILTKGNTKKGIKLLALSYLYENTVLQSFPLTKIPAFQAKLRSLIFDELKVDGTFFEGLLILIATHTIPVEAARVNFDSFKIDFKKTMCLKNLIHLIETHEHNNIASHQIAYNFELGYSYWLHTLYYILGSLYTIAKRYDDGAQAGNKALQYCPAFYEAKALLGFCLENLYSSVSESKPPKNIFKPNEKDFAQNPGKDWPGYENQRRAEQSYLRWKSTDLRKETEKVFLEYLKEAPVCDKKYPNCNYHLALTYLLDRDIKKAYEWKAKGEDAEEKRLPFMETVDIDAKKLLMTLDLISLPGKKHSKVVKLG